MAVAAKSESVAVTSLGHERRRRGRPRNGEIDKRILDAATELYAERGWSGFNFDVVARRARVSKDAIYRRFSDPLQLLLTSWSGYDHSDSHRREMALPADANTREYMRAVTTDHFQMFARESGFDHLRVYVEAKHNPELLKAFSVVQSSNITRIRHRVRQAMSDGLLPQAASPTAVIDALVGGVAMHVMATPPRLRRRMVKESPVYIADLVDLVLRGCGYAFSEPAALDAD